MNYVDQGRMEPDTKYQLFDLLDETRQLVRMVVLKSKLWRHQSVD